MCHEKLKFNSWLTIMNIWFSFQSAARVAEKRRKKAFLSFCGLWTNVFVGYGQRYTQLFFILSEDL